MSVKISYTGVDGKTTRFGATSPTDAMARLNGIKGYGGNVVDSAAAGLARGFISRMGRNAARVASMNAQQRENPLTRIYGANGGGVSSHGGQAARVKTMTGVRMDDDGNLIADEREDYVTQDGRVAQVGRTVERNLGKVKADADKVVSVEKDDSGKSSVRVMVGVEYDNDTHQLLAIMARLVVKNGVISLSPDTTKEIITTAVEETVVT